METNKNIIDKPFERELRSSFLDYAMSVIVSRALPDVRDGLKPVHRRLMYSMWMLGMTHNKAFNKSARIVGDVIGKYHPHGDSAVYEALVRLTQPWNLQSPLVEGQGNFGSMDGDGAAAMRYTEARMSKLADELLVGLKKNTVEFQDNYDGREQEPKVLPARFPNLLVNGTSGIAVGMANEMVTHNLGEVIDAAIKQINNPDIKLDELMQDIIGPDFPTGGVIMGTTGIEEAYKTGKGTIVVRGKATIEEVKGEIVISISQIPYKVGRHTLKDELKKIQIAYDEYNKERNKKGQRFIKKKPNNALDFVKKDSIKTDKRKKNLKEDNVGILLTLKRGVDPNVVINHLYRYTSLQTTISINNTVLVPRADGKLRPQVLGLKRLLEEYIKHQKEVYLKEAQFDLDKLSKSSRNLEALYKALKDLDRVLKIIRQAETDKEAILGLISLLNVSEDQAKYILDRRIRSISGYEQKEIVTRMEEISVEIDKLKEIINSEEKLNSVIIQELQRIKEAYGRERRTKILPPAEDMSLEDLIQNERIVVTLSKEGYIKSTLESNYRTQKRNGRGVHSINLDSEDFTKHLDVLYRHDNLLLFSNYGKVYSLKGYEIPESQTTAKGVYLYNLIPALEENEVIQSVVSVRDFNEQQNLFFTTANGKVKKTPLSQFKNIRRSGIVAIKFEEENDRLVSVALTTGENHIVIVTKKGQAIKFSEAEVRGTARDTQGVKGITLKREDIVIAADIDESNGELFVITELGIGKRSPLSDFKLQTRGGSGARSMRIGEKTGDVVGALIVDREDSVYVQTIQGLLIKLKANNLSIYSRNAQGTKVINLKDDDGVQSIARLSEEDTE